MTTIDKTSPEYLAGRADLANELLAKTKVRKPLTLNDVRAMSTEQILARKPEVDAVLARGGQS